ncbi:MAG: helix-turn-helix transcriptional regulator [Clostridia bacterium]|nr:helix-turn-helix transcriptional regulator [Clostridia bacterium]
MNRIRHLREKASLRQIDVANATGIDQKTLSNYETEKTYPDSYSLIRLADFFGVTIDYLVCRDESRFSSDKKEEAYDKIEQLKKELDELKKYI